MTTKYILINSRLRDSGNPSNFRIFFEKEIVIKDYLQLSYLVMPRNNYLINNSNNILKINFGNNAPINIYLLNQNYSPVELALFINTQCSGNPFGFSCNYNSNNYKFIFTANRNFELDFSINLLHRIFSLEKKSYSSTGNQFTTNIINFNYPSYLNLNIQNIPQNVMLNTNQNYLSNNFIIPLNTINFSSIIEYNNINYNIKMFCKDLHLNYFDIIITDDYDQYFDNNDANFYAIFEYNSY